MSLRHLLDRRAEIRASMERLNAAHADGAFPDAAQAEWDASRTELDGLEARITRQTVLDDLARRTDGQPIGGTGDRRLDDDITRRYSLTRALAGAAGLRVDNAYELEVSAELARRSGRQPGGIFIPLLALNPPMERRVTTTAAPSSHVGGNIIGTTLESGQFISPMYAPLVVRKAGARIISGLTSNVDIPKQDQTLTGYWVAENSDITFSDPGFAKVSLRPKHYGAITEFSRNMLLQSSPDIEGIVRADMTAVLARGLDSAAIAGTGSSNQPTGILSTAGIGAVAMGTNGAAITWAAVVALIEAVEVANVGDDSRAFIGNPKVRASASQVLKVSGQPMGFIMDAPGTLAGYPYYSTTLTPSNGTKGSGSNLSALIYGNRSDLLIGLWSEIDILVNPYAETAYTKGNVQVRAMMTCDIEVRHAESFAAITDIVAA
jgi:HK97 family phage major capsid protein